MSDPYTKPRTSNTDTLTESTPRSGVNDNLAASPDQITDVYNRPRVLGGLSKNTWIAIAVAIAILLLLLVL